MPRDQPQAAILLIQMAALIAQHEPEMDELLDMLGISRAQANRYIATLRTVGCKVVAARNGNHRFFRIEDAGVFSLPALRTWRNTGAQEAALQALADESQRLGLYNTPAEQMKRSCQECGIIIPDTRRRNAKTCSDSCSKAREQRRAAELARERRKNPEEAEKNRIVAREWYWKNREHVLGEKKKWREQNPETARQRSKASAAKHYAKRKAK